MRYIASGTTYDTTHYVTDVNQLEAVLTNLNHYTRYYVYVSGKTTPGCGVEASTSFVTLENGKKISFIMTESTYCIVYRMFPPTDTEKYWILKISFTDFFGI